MPHNIVSFALITLLAFCPDVKAQISKESHPVLHNERRQQMSRKSTPAREMSPAPPISYSATPFRIIKVNQDTGAAPQNEPSVRINPKDPDNIVVAFRDFRLGWDPPIRNVTIATTTDGGQTWHEQFAQYLNHNRFTDPSVAVDTAGNFYVATIDWNDSLGGVCASLRKSTDHGMTWLPAIADTFAYDKDMIYVDDSPTSPFCNFVYLASAGMSGFARSTDMGAAFSFSQDTVALVWPTPATGPHGELYIAGGGSDSTGRSGIVVVKSTDGGLTFAKPIVASDSGAWITQCSTCTIDENFPWSSEPIVGVDKSFSMHRGSVYVVWLADPPNLFCNRSDDGGKSWSKGVIINNNCGYSCIANTVLLNWMAVDDSGFVDVVFLDRRNDPSGILCDAYFAQSRDGGLTFKNFRITPQNFDPRIYPNTNVRIGDYIGVDARGGRIVPCWVDTHLGNQDIYIAIIDQARTATIEGKIVASSPEGYEHDLWFALDNGYNMVLSDSTGHYSFTGLYPGTYHVYQGLFPVLFGGRWMQTYPDSQQGYTVTIDSSEHITGLDFHNSFVTSVGPVTPSLSFQLLQNYPNPFNGATVIIYELQGESRGVSLTVYNVLGQEVQKLVNLDRQMPGRYEVPWDAGSLPSGIYFYRLRTSAVSQTRTLAIVR